MKHRERAWVAFGALAFLLAITLLRPPPTPGPYGRDFEAYYAAGATWRHGGDPYGRDVWAVERTIDGVEPNREELLPYVGPAAALPLFAVLSLAPHPVALRIWSGLLALALATVVFAALWLGGVRRDPWRFVVALGTALASGPVMSSLALGQAALLSAAGIALALLGFAARRGVLAWAGTLVAAIQPNLALALIARMRDRRAVAIAAAAFLGFAVLTVGASGLGHFPHYLRVLAEHADAERFTTIQHTLVAVAWSFGVPNAGARALGVALFPLFAALVAFAIAHYRLDPEDGALLGIAVLPLAIPFFHEHDFAIELLPAIVLALRARGAVRIVALAGSVAVLVDWLGFAQRPPAQAHIVALALTVACGLAALGRARDARAGAAALGVVAALVVVALPIARAHPAPVWPEALPSHWRSGLPADAPAAALWAAEQNAAGLGAREPAWGFLRAIPLGGCALLAVAVVASARPRRRRLLDVDVHEVVERRRGVGVPAG